MFVQSNKISELKVYFNDKLRDRFSPNETKLMFQVCLQKRLQLTSSDLLLLENIRFSESDLLFFRNVVHRLLKDEPFQYIIGETLFCDLTILCDKRALIPRPETEELVYWIKESLIYINQEISIVDFCTGSACIALALKHIFPDCKMYATDVSKEALSLAKKNAKLNHLELDFLQNDLLKEDLDFFPEESLDCIVSNPPYIPEMDKNKMNNTVLEFEPPLALFVLDDDPLIFYRKIAEIALQKLKKGALLFFEIHEHFGEQIKMILADFGFQQIEIKKDLQGKNRMIRAKK